MKVIVSNGNPGEYDVAEAPEPQRRQEEAVVAVESFAVNRGEVAALPLIPAGSRVGWDFAGRVIDTPDGSGLEIGARVVGLLSTGAWAERVAVPVRSVAVIPEGVSNAEAAALPIAGLTALKALELGGLLIGRRVAVTGASGGVGRFAVQLARIAGADVTAVASASKADQLEALGANRVVQDLASTDPQVYDLILEGVGGSSFGASLQRVAAYGTAVVFASTNEQDVSFPATAFRNRPGSRAYSLRVFDAIARDGAGADLSRLLSLVRAGKLDPQVAFEASWTRLDEAISRLLDRSLDGKAVLHVD